MPYKTSALSKRLQNLYADGIYKIHDQINNVAESIIHFIREESQLDFETYYESRTFHGTEPFPIAASEHDTTPIAANTDTLSGLKTRGPTTSLLSEALRYESNTPGYTGLASIFRNATGDHAQMTVSSTMKLTKMDIVRYPNIFKVLLLEYFVTPSPVDPHLWVVNALNKPGNLTTFLGFLLLKARSNRSEVLALFFGRLAFGGKFIPPEVQQLYLDRSMMQYLLFLQRFDLDACKQIPDYPLPNETDCNGLLALCRHLRKNSESFSYV